MWQTLALRRSAAWLHRSHRAMLFTDFLEVEHMSHAGHKNGALVAPHRQLMAWGMRAETIRDAIQENIDRKLVERMAGGGMDLETGKRKPFLYRLTYLPTVDAPPTNEWKRYKATAPAKSAEKADKAKRAIAARWRHGKQNPATESGSRALPKAVAGEDENPPISAKSLIPKPVAGHATETGNTSYICMVSTMPPVVGTTCEGWTGQLIIADAGAPYPLARTTCEAWTGSVPDGATDSEIWDGFEANLGLSFKSAKNLAPTANENDATTGAVG